MELPSFMLNSLQIFSKAVLGLIAAYGSAPQTGCVRGLLGFRDILAWWPFVVALLCLFDGQYTYIYASGSLPDSNLVIFLVPFNWSIPYYVC